MNKYFQDFGFSAKAELLNGRLAMIGLTVGVIIELITGQGIVSQLNLL